MAFRRALLVRILTTFLLLSGSVEMRKPDRSAEAQFQPPVMSNRQRVLLEEYNQMKRWSPNVYEENEFLTEPWATYDGDQWDGHHWSEGGDDDDMGLSGEFDDLDNTFDDLKQFDYMFQGLPDASNFEKQQSQDEFGRQGLENSGAQDEENEAHHAFSTQTGTNDETGTGAGKDENMNDHEFGIENGTDEVVGTDFGFVLMISDDVIYSVQAFFDFCMSGVTTIYESLDKCTEYCVIEIKPLVLKFIHSVIAHEYVEILKEEIIDPVYNSWVDMCYSYIYPVVQSFMGVRFNFFSTLKTDASVMLSKYVLKAKYVNDQPMIAMSSIVEKVSLFVQTCGDKECLLSSVNTYFQDELVYCKLVWVAVYMIIAIFLLYCSYVSNTAMLIFTVCLSKSVMKAVICLLGFFFGLCRKSHKCKPKVSVGSQCAFDQFKVGISETRYNDLIEASERKVGQLQRILQLENQLEGLQINNVIGFYEMYQKQDQLDKMETHVV